MACWHLLRQKSLLYQFQIMLLLLHPKQIIKQQPKTLLMRLYKLIDNQ
jgi:hypothetical protein